MLVILLLSMLFFAVSITRLLLFSSTNKYHKKTFPPSTTKHRALIDDQVETHLFISLKTFVFFLFVAESVLNVSLDITMYCQ